MKMRLLMVEDDQAVRWSLAETCRDDGFEVLEAGSLAEGRALLTQEPDVLLLDLKLPDGDGESLLIEARERNPSQLVIIMSGHATKDARLHALGASNVIPKPFSPITVLLPILHQAREVVELRFAAAQERSGRPAAPEAQGAKMRKVEDDVEKFAPTKFKILLRGPSGSGKTFFARRIHELSGRKGNFVQANCGAIPSELIESELFGHEAGAFTDAKQLKRGFFEQADGGTLLLDEIGDMPLSLQVKLLKVVEENAITRLGAERPTPVDVRLICATHRNLEALIKQERFREDLYHRINVGVITLPSLKERDYQDFLAMAETTLLDLSREINRQFQRIAPSAGEVLYMQPWPGNIRELQNTLQRIVIHENGPELTREMVMRHLVLHTNVEAIATGVANAVGFGIGEPWPTLPELKRRYMEHIVKLHNGNLSRAAQVLGISRKTLERERAAGTL